MESVSFSNLMQPAMVAQTGGRNPEFQKAITATIEDFLRNAGIQVSQTPSPDGLLRLSARAAGMDDQFSYYSPSEYEKMLLQSQHEKMGRVLGGEDRAASTLHPRLRQGKLVVFHSSGNPIGPHQLVKQTTVEMVERTMARNALSTHPTPTRTPTGILGVMNPGDRLEELTHIAQQLEELQKGDGVSRLRLPPRVSEADRLVDGLIEIEDLNALRDLVREKGSLLSADDLNALRDLGRAPVTLQADKLFLTESLMKILEKTDPDFYEKLDKIFNMRRPTFWSAPP